MKRSLLCIIIFIGTTTLLFSQDWGVKTNIAHWATGITPNIGAEVALNRKYTLEIGAGYNPFKYKDNKKLQHWLVQPELRYWTCEAFNGHFFGLHLLAGSYNAGGVDIPIGRLSDLKDYRYEGTGFGGGLSYGYQWAMSKRFNFELNIGAGYVYLDYDKYPCTKCGKKIESTSKNYFGITKMAVSLIYLID